MKWGMGEPGGVVRFLGARSDSVADTSGRGFQILEAEWRRCFPDSQLPNSQGSSFL